MLNPEALTRTPNLIFSVDGYEARRSICCGHHQQILPWIINKSCKHSDSPSTRYASNNKMDERKVIAEIMGSCLYAG